VPHVPATDAFAVFGIARTLDLDAADLERRYLKLSRECHPDHHRAENEADATAVLQRAAEVNDAWKVLRDPWRRARALLEAERHGVLEANKKLDPMFLAEALELAEEVAFAEGEQVAALRERLRSAADAGLDALKRDVEAEDLDAAARRVHESHYYLKALRDLEAKG